MSLFVFVLAGFGLTVHAGSGFAPRVTIVHGEVHYAQPADIDSDGDIDIVAADDVLNGAVRVWENIDGDGLRWVAHDVGTHLGRPIMVLDADRDGDPDIVHFDAGSELYQFTNTDGSGESWRKNMLEIDFGSVSSFGIGDIDGDGHLDFVATEDDDLAWFSREESGWQLHQIEIEHQNIITTDPVDLDGDGDLDVLGWSEAGATFWYENDELQWIRHRVEVFNHIEGHLGVGDLDGDGDLDLMGAAANPLGLAWLENAKGDASEWLAHRFDAGFSLIDGLEDSDYYSVEDLDQDGDLDVAVGSFPRCLVAWLENIDNGTRWSGHAIDELEEPTLMFTADVTGDGFLDIVGASREDEGLAYWANVSLVATSANPGRPVVTKIERQSTEQLILTWTSIPGAHYRVDHSRDLQTWAELNAPTGFGFFTGEFSTTATIAVEPSSLGYVRITEQ